MKLISDGRVLHSKLLVIGEDGSEIDISHFVNSIKLDMNAQTEEPEMILRLCARYVDVDVVTSALKGAELTVLNVPIPVEEHPPIWLQDVLYMYTNGQYERRSD